MIVRDDEVLKVLVGEVRIFRWPTVTARIVSLEIATAEDAAAAIGAWSGIKFAHCTIAART